MPRRFAYQPSLDGVRAVAVMLVLAFHGGFGWMTGGYVGVSVFFTLSGFLITSLALVEHERTGALDVRGFYARRLRRLMPASALCLLAVVVLAATGVLAGVPHLRRDVWAAVVPVYNWVALAGGRSYSEVVAVAGDPASPLDHYWSLAIEEQFYWVWPLILVGLFKLRHTGRLVVVGTLVAATVAAAPVIHAVWGPDAAYWATPARLAEIVIGALLAVLLHRRPVTGRLASGARWLAPAGLAVVIWAAVTWPAGGGPAYSGWLPVFALASAALIFGLQAESPLRRLLSARPVVFVGTISYGVYLFHWPIYAVLDRQRTGLDGAVLFAVRIVVTLAVATLSFHAVEHPIRRTNRLGWRPAVTAALASGGVVVLLASALPTERPAYWEMSSPRAVALAPVESLAPLARVAPTVPAPTVPAVRVASAATATVAPATVRPRLSRPVRILVVGDSTASATGQGLVAWAARHHDQARVSVEWAPGFGFIRRGERRGLDAEIATACDALRLRLHDELVHLRPDVVMLMTTVADVEDRVVDDTAVVAPPSVEFAALMTEDYVGFVDELAAAGVRRVAWVVPPEPLVPWMGDLAPLADPARWTALREGIDEVGARRPDVVTVVDLAGWEARQRSGDRRPDGLHYSLDAATTIADEFLGPLLISVATS